ncbi:hypothetical protein, partial [Eggerthella lenta]|uniref:hypothetical protein n=1 Tax=Eggerthella lenta TaxID=84112 RepID=UPI001E64CCB0
MTVGTVSPNRPSAYAPAASAAPCTDPSKDVPAWGHRAREIARLPVRRVESVERRLRVGRTLVERIGDRDERLFGRIAFGQRLSRLAHLGG